MLALRLADLDSQVIAGPDVAVDRAIECLVTMPPVTQIADPEGTYDRAALTDPLADARHEVISAAQRVDAAGGSG